MSFKNKISKSEMPFERLKKYGPAHLSDAELLAVMIRNGTKTADPTQIAHNLLLLSGKKGLAGIMTVSEKSLQKIEGIGDVKALQLIALGEISKRIAASSFQRERLSDPESCAAYFMERLRYESEEQVWAAAFDSKFSLLAEKMLSCGISNSSLITPREIFRFAIEQRAVSIILVHNHPSGDPTPSMEDIDLTKQVSKAGEIVGIALADHIIIGDNRYYSMKEYGHMG